MTDLLDAWRDAVRSAGATAGAAAVDAAGADLLARWAQPHRRHHDTEHLTEVLAAIDLLVADAADPAAVRLAAWFHDAVYDGRPGDDEEASAVLAEEVLTRLGVPDDRVARAARLVRMTAAHVPSDGDPDEAVLSDADLAILAAPAPRYARYAAAVRAEYAHVPDDAFRAGRSAVLAGLVAADRLYRTAPGRQRWEAAARANVAAELEALRG
ncbi:metal-dependent phosphohydrolase [Kineosporia sp. R_H_3]|uniref:HD domain-containing protein n=1 Tax=Kineosporia sp. R_H_3 TaxID=1961848 RepID=UPI000B4AE029|nr:metal-dependent phosphohydrolase [Kineosporia sp. R_H_3]